MRTPWKALTLMMALVALSAAGFVWGPSGAGLALAVLASMGIGYLASRRQSAGDTRPMRTAPPPSSQFPPMSTRPGKSASSAAQRLAEQVAEQAALRVPPSPEIRQPITPPNPQAIHHTPSTVPQADAGEALEALQRAEAYLVRELRTWRPEVVLTHAADPRGIAPTEHLLHQLVVRAVESAADPQAFPEQLARWNLSPWQAKRVFSYAVGQQKGSVSLATGEIDVRRGAAPLDLTAPCRARLFAEENPPPLSIAARLTVNRSAGVAAHEPPVFGRYAVRH